jgi:hypothetical protein
MPLQVDPTCEWLEDLRPQAGLKTLALGNMFFATVIQRSYAARLPPHG